MTAPRPLAAAPSHAGSVLLVDDDVRLAPLVTRMLGLLGFGRVEIALDATAARIALETMHICLVISDIDLPGPENGLSLLRWVRSTDGLRNVPFIVTEQNLRFEEVRAAHESGADGILLKPYAADLVRKKIAAAVSGSARRKVSRAPAPALGDPRAEYIQSLYGLQSFRAR